MDATATAQAPALMDAKAAAAYLDIGERTLWGHTSPRGELKCVRIGAAVRYRQEDLDAWIASRVG